MHLRCKTGDLQRLIGALLVYEGVHDLRTRPSLILRLSEGVDPGAWQEFSDRYAGLIKRVLAERGVQAADRDDITQEVLISLVKAMPGFEYDPSRGRFRSYLKTVVIRALARRHRRKASPGMELRDEETLPGGEELERIWERQWRQYHMRRAWRQIEVEFSPEDRAVFEAYALQGKKAQVVAELHGISVDRVYRIKSTMLGRVTEIVGEQVAEEG